MGGSPCCLKPLSSAQYLKARASSPNAKPFAEVGQAVKEGEAIALGHNQPIIGHDPTAHAEIVAIRTACRNLQTFSLAGCELYSSCEPCPMCLGAIYWARLKRIYYSNTRSDAAKIGRPCGSKSIEIPASAGPSNAPTPQISPITA